MSVTRTVIIETLAHKGDGALTIDGAACYIPYTLTGEEVTLAQDRDGNWRLKEIITPSPARVAPVCGHFENCGGCALQHFRHADYLGWKRESLRETLAQRGFEDVEIADIYPIQPGSRRRLALSAVMKKSKVILGFNKARRNDIEDITECPVALPKLVDALPTVRELLALGLKDKVQARVTLNATGSGPDVRVDTKKGADLSPHQVASMAQVTAQRGVTRLSWDGDLIYQEQSPEVDVDGIRVVPPPGAFLQASERAQALLIEKVTAYTSDAKKVVDLFCGIGTFALPVSRYAQVTAFDSAGDMIEALNTAANRAGIGNKLSAQRRDLFRRPLQASELKVFDTAILDPPRVGALDQSQQLALSSLRRIVYVSCNPATFARDARFLVNEGFRMGTVLPIDQFLWSPHTELIAVFDR